MKPVRVQSGYVTADTALTTSRTTLFCVYACGGTRLGGNVNHHWDFKNGSSSGDVLYRVQRYSNGGYAPIGELEIPDAGIVFPDGIYIDLSWVPLSSSSAMTVFYQQ
mgnify:CR=1 FL=1